MSRYIVKVSSVFRKVKCFIICNGGNARFLRHLFSKCTSACKFENRNGASLNPSLVTTQIIHYLKMLISSASSTC